MTLIELIKKAQAAIGASPDGDWGPVSQSRADGFDIDVIATEKVPLPAEPIKPVSEVAPPWYSFAKKFNGKKETDATFSSYMIGRIRTLFGMRTDSIATSTWAWCGFAMAVALSGAGLKYAKDGPMAKAWGKYGDKIEWQVVGIPRGAIIHLNHKFNCSSGSSNHVGQAEGDCTAEDLKKPGATFDLYGGNQNNTWKVSNYSVKEICEVRWPSEYPKREKIEKSVDCTSGKKGGESTR